MGGELSGARVRRAADRLRRRAIRRRTSPSTRSAARRSWPIRTGAAGAISPRARSPRQGPRGRAHGARTSPISRRRRCSASSAASLQDRDNPTFSFDADFQVESYLRHQGIDLRRALRRQLLSLHHPRDGLFRPRRRLRRRAGQRVPRHARRASAWSRSPRDWLFPTAESRAIVHALNAAGAARLVRRDRDRQGPRRLPARRAGAVRDRARLPRRRRRGARPARRGGERCSRASSAI